ncbi:hypothetical protein ACHAO1_010788 [Botrytis cinerea]
MTSPKPKAPASPSPAEGTSVGNSSSMPTGISSPIKSSTKIKLQLKDKNFALPSLPEKTPVGNSSSMPTGIPPPIKSSTKIKLQFKDKNFALPSLPKAPAGDSSSMPTETMPPAKKFKRGSEFTEGLNLLDAHRSSLPKHRGMSYYKRRTAALAGIDQMVLEESSERTVLEQHSRATISESSSSTQAASATAFSSTHREIMTTTKPSKIVILKLPPAKLLTISTSTKAASAGSSLKPTTSSSNLASFTNKASPLPIAATSDRVYSSRGRKLRKTFKAEEGDPRSNVAAQNVAAQNLGQKQMAGQKRKAPVKKRVRFANTEDAPNVDIAADATYNQSHEPAKKRLKFTNTGEARNIDIATGATSNKDLESAKTSKVHKSNVAPRARIETAARSQAVISRVKKALGASREALSRAQLVAWEEERETKERGLREKMGKALRDWEALEKQRDLEAEQEN